QPLPFAVDEHSYLRPVRIRRVSFDDERHVTSIETNERAGRIDANELNEPTNEMPIELLTVIAFEHGKDPIGRKCLLVPALGAHGIVDIRDAAEHRAEVQGRARYSAGIARSIDPQMVLECDHRSERRDLRCLTKDFRAVDGMPPHDLELGI